jgi:hypothetical protein
METKSEPIKDETSTEPKSELKCELKSDCSRHGEALYMEVKANSLGFSQWSALSPAKRARYENQSTRMTK